MGEKIKDVGNIRIKGVEYGVEINEPVDRTNGALIHIQNDSFQMAVTQRELYDMAAVIILAKKQLMHIKHIDEGKVKGKLEQ